MSPSGQTASSLYSGIARPILLALTAVAILFLIFELAERLWLQELDNQTLHFLHLIRGIIASLVAAVLVGWLIFRLSPPLSELSQLTEISDRDNRPTKKELLASYSLWFIRMRWIAIFIASMLTWLVVRVAEWLPQEVWWPLAGTITALALLNLVYDYLFRNEMFPKKYFLPFQAYADLLILVILLHFSGGIENPLSLLMLFHVIIAGIILSRRHCYTVATTATVLLALVATAEATEILNHYTLSLFPHAAHEAELAHASLHPYYVVSYVGLLSVIFFLTAYFVTTLADRLRHGERQLEKFADQAHEHRQLIEKSLETTNTGLCVCNRKGEPYWINQRWEMWFESQTIDNFAKANQLKQPMSACNVLKDKKNHVAEITVKMNSAQNETNTYRITTAPLFGKDGHMDHVISLAQDITDQKKAQDQMIRAGKLAAVGELAGHVAHEVNNPIGIISAKARLLISDRSDEMSAKVKQELQKIIDSADRVAQIAQGLLFYCRPSVATRTQTDITIPILEAFSLIEQRAKNNNVVLDNQLPERLPPVEANADEMQQVFLNLYLNALDSMPDGGTLLVSASLENSHKQNTNRSLIITVQDTGSGIPKEIQEQIFEPFFTTKEEGKGTGLGLSICAGLIRSHDGTISLESEPGKGTRIIVHLPIKSNQTEGA